ncbi:MAG: FtsW/RodA/SpoVE family cell cycle protein [Bacteroidales bacterium]|nr:FtsW/RodA/SpoVE family cell cycle protein [Bacteroidales bacterium]
MKVYLARYFKGDPVIWAIIVVLSIYSLLAVYSSTGTLVYKYHGGNTFYFLFKQTSFLIVAIIVTYLTHLVHYKHYLRLSKILLYISVFLLLFTLIMGTSLNSATRWITLPGGVTFQTSDFAKLSLIIYISKHLAVHQENIKDYEQAYKPLIRWVGIIVVLILPANFSTAAMVFIISVVLMFIGRINVKHLLRTAGLGTVGVFLIILLIYQFPNSLPRGETWKARVESFLNGSSEDNYQAEQAKIAIAEGGIFGKGPGNSTQRNFIPHPYSDFIYSVIIEEYGLLFGALPLLILYLWLLFRAGVLVRNSSRTFPALLAIGLSFSLVFQAMLNMAVNVNLFPVTGQTIPFVSLGGSSLLFTSCALGIILSISRSYQNEQKHGTETQEDNN